MAWPFSAIVLLAFIMFFGTMFIARVWWLDQWVDDPDGWYNRGIGK